MLFRTEHFSAYGVGYKSIPAFTDTTNHWARDDIEFAAARDLLSGTGNNTFSPYGAITRAMFATALGRLAGIYTGSYPSGTFSDVKADAYYAPYVEWAASKNIMAGTGGEFKPDSIVTREEMAVVMQRYAAATGFKLPSLRETVVYADSATISAWAAEAVTAMQRAGVLMGKSGNRFDPAGPATRAEAAALLHRYVELLIDLDTAQGWEKNDNGEWMYYVNGRPVTGNRAIDGTTYYFDALGILQSIEPMMPDTKKYITYIVKKNDTLWALAKKYNCTVAEIVALNQELIRNPNFILIGWELKIPQK